MRALDYLRTDATIDRIDMTRSMITGTSITGADALATVTTAPPVINEHPNFIQVPQKNKIVTKMLHNGFCFLKSKTTKGSTYWVCDKAKLRSCRARITIFNDTGCYQVTNNIHTHPALLPKFERGP